MKMEIDGEAKPGNGEAHSALLSTPGSMTFTQDCRLPEGDRDLGHPEVTDFSLSRQGHFGRQYAHTYFVRLTSLRPVLERRIHEAWPDITLKKIAGLCESSSAVDGGPMHNSPKKYTSPRKGTGHGADRTKSSSSAQDEHHGQHIALREDVTVAIIGTVFKQQPDKPSILQELVEEIQLQDRTKKESYISSKDVVILEDETTRVRLVPTDNCGLTIDGLVNGIVLGVKGRPTIDGKFEVEAVMWPTPSPVSWAQVTNPEESEMVLVSGLCLGSPSNSVELGLLFEHLQGLCGSPYEQTNAFRKRNSVFFLGNSLFADVITSGSGSERAKALAQNVKKLDHMLSILAATMHVYLISGKEDPVEVMYPQPPLHRLLFPKSADFPSFHLLSNPARVTLPLSDAGSLEVVLTDGEPVLDALKYSDVTSGLEMGRRLLEWAHLCPTAPDTLPLHPGVEQDVFILDTLPHLFLIGNQREFGHVTWNQSKVVSVPSFNSTASAVLISKDFTPRQLKFNLLA